MCDPISIALATTAAAGGGIAAIDRNNQAQAQQREITKYRKYQLEKRRQERQRQDLLRDQGEAQRAAAVSQLAGPEQQDAQQQEAVRLEQELSGGPMAADTPYSDKLLSGQGGASREVSDEIARRVKGAVDKARDQIKSQAVLGSYGGSRFGLARRNEDIFTQAGQGIDLANNFRRGSLGAWGVEQQVQPQQVAPQTGMGNFGDLLFGVGTAGLARGSNAFPFFGQAGPAATATVTPTAATPLAGPAWEYYGRF